MTSTTTVPVRTQADALALIDETVEFYGQDPKGRRGVTVTAQQAVLCRYDTGDGRKCAVGRCFLDSVGDRWRFSRDPVAYRVARMELMGETFDSHLKPEYQGYPMNFWGRLQDLHDSSNHWAKPSGLTETGQMKVESFKQWVRYHSGMPSS